VENLISEQSPSERSKNVKSLKSTEVSVAQLAVKRQIRHQKSYLTQLNEINVKFLRAFRQLGKKESPICVQRYKEHTSV
jgi:hypothetical protein